MENNKKKIGIIILCSVVAILLVLGIVLFINAQNNKITQNPIVTMEVQDFGTIKIELYPELAPNTVKNFVALTQNGFYNGTKFHRVVSDFMIQAGSANGDGTGSPKLSDLGIKAKEDKEYCIKGEFWHNRYKKNTLKHEKGVISMARADYTTKHSSLIKESYNSASSQFFIMTANVGDLDGIYAPFGKVIEGLDVVEKIENVEVYAKQQGGEVSTPVNEIVISNVTVETFGTDYGVPKTLDPFDYSEWRKSVSK